MASVKRHGLLSALQAEGRLWSLWCGALQVWWYVGGCFPQLAVHDLAKNETKSVKTNRNMPGITVMAQVHSFPLLAWHMLHAKAPNVNTDDGQSIDMHEVALHRAQDITGNVWTGHRDGYVRVWGEASHNPVCAPYRAMHSDITCAQSPSILFPSYFLLEIQGLSHAHSCHAHRPMSLHYAPPQNCSIPERCMRRST